MNPPYFDTLLNFIDLPNSVAIITGLSLRPQRYQILHPLVVKEPGINTVRQHVSKTWYVKASQKLGKSSAKPVL